MRTREHWLRALCLLLILALAAGALSACSPQDAPAPKEQPENGKADTSRYLTAVEDVPDTVDFQCTSIHYTVAQNVFDRLVETESGQDGGVTIQPSLAESWEVADGGRVYTFHLREGVAFSNGRPLTASDVLYTFTRLLTHPDACNQDVADCILGADALMRGETDTLSGFTVLSDTDFSVTLKEPFEAFLACLSMPGASILDEETTREAGDRFGHDPAWTVGTGPFVFTEWTADHLLLAANPACWAGAPACAGLDLKFVTEAETVRAMYEKGELDVMDLDELDGSAEFFIRGDIYQSKLYQARQVAIYYVALNESVEPLNDVRVRKALQLALNRTLLLDAIYSGRGSLENGIFPQGLYGYDPELPEIPCDPDRAAALLKEAGYGDGFDLVFSVSAASTPGRLSLAKMIVNMWLQIGVRAEIRVLEDGEFISLRKAGALACYTAAWMADYDDPDNFIYTFFGNAQNTAFRSLCYPDAAVMDRVTRARGVADPQRRLAEYHALERKIVQEDAAWIPLFSRQKYYVVSDRLSGFGASWNGSVKNNYRHMSVGGR